MGAITRRDFNRLLAAGAGTAMCSGLGRAEDSNKFRLHYIIASCMYGKTPLVEIVPEVPKAGAEYIEIWAERHGNQREQIDEMGEDAFRELLKANGVKLGSFTCFKYGLFNMRGEMELVRRLGGDMVICNSGGPKDLEGDALHSAVAAFAEKLKPEVDYAEQTGVVLGLENHGGGLISSPESIRMLMDMIPSSSFGLAMAPYHLPQDTEVLGQLIRDLGDRLVHIQAWEYGMGCMTKLPKEQELMQLPHRGPLDWTPILAALKDIDYAGRVEIFMHPTPRGIPILEPTAAVTAEINKARQYLEECLSHA